MNHPALSLSCEIIAIISSTSSVPKNLLFNNSPLSGYRSTLGGLTGNKCKGQYGHGYYYWLNSKALPHETFAHLFEAYARNDIIVLEILKEVFPTAYDKFVDILRRNL